MLKLPQDTCFLDTQYLVGDSGWGGWSRDRWTALDGEKEIDQGKEGGW